MYYDKLGQMEIPTKIAAGKSGALESGNNIFYIVVTSSDATQVNTYKLTIHRSYEKTVDYYFNSNIIKSESVFTGNKYVANYIPTIKGYKFNRWETKLGTEYKEDVLLSSLSLYADVTALSYTVTFDVSGGNELEKNEKTVTFDANYNLQVPTRTGYSFVGWYYGNTKLTDAKGASLESWSYDSDKNLTAQWKVNQYDVNVDKNIDNAGEITGEGKHDFDSNVTITADTNLGYEFLGWYEGDKLLTTDLSYTFVISTKTYNYTAKWKINDDLSNFEIDSTKTTLTITGVKNKAITEVIVPDYVTNIAKSAFSGCNQLQSMTLTFVGNGSEKTHLGYIFGADTYSDNKNYVPSSLKEVILTNCTGIGSEAFYGCSNLTSVTIPDSVTSIGANAFNGCYSLQEVHIKSLESWCAIDFANSDANPLSKGELYLNGELVTELIIPDSVKSIGSSAFYGCSGLTSVTIGNNVTSISYNAFGGCSNLTSVAIPNSVTSIGSSAFSDCSSLTSITIPDSVTSIGLGAFEGCSSLLSMTLPFVGNGSGETHFGYIFGADTYSDNKNYVPRSLQEVILTNCTSIGSYAFSSCYNLRSIIIPDSVTSIGYGAFEDSSNSSLQSITLPFVGNGSGKTYFGYIFGADTYSDNKNYVPSSLKEVILTNCTSIRDYAFYNCDSLTSIVIPNSVTSIGYRTFVGCKSLTSVTIPDSVTSIGSSAFSGCVNLSSITIHNNVTNIEFNSFSGCSLLTTINYNGTVEYFKAIEKELDWDYNTPRYVVKCTDGEINKSELH